METKKFKDLEDDFAYWEKSEKSGIHISGNPEQELIEEVKKRFGDADSFLMKFTPSNQALLSEFVEMAGDYPTVKSVCLAYGKEVIHGWICARLMDLTRFANCNSLTKGQTKELSTIIVNESQKLKVTEILGFFYLIMSGKMIADTKISPMAIMLNYRAFSVRRYKKRLSEEEKNFWKVYLIVKDHPDTKVYARVFRTKENAEKALEERDYRTGERLYPGCHVIERIVE